MVPHWSLRLCSFLFILFFLLFNTMSFQMSSSLLILSSISSNLLNSSTEFFISLIVLSRTRIYLWFLLVIFISSLIVSFYSFITFLTSFSYLFMVSFSWLNIIDTVNLMYLIGNTNIEFFSILSNCLFLVNGPNFSVS